MKGIYMQQCAISQMLFCIVISDSTKISFCGSTGMYFPHKWHPAQHNSLWVRCGKRWIIHATVEVCSPVGYCITCVGPVVHTGCLSSLRHHAFHSESLLGVVETEKDGLAKTQHTACTQSKTTFNEAENENASNTCLVKYFKWSWLGFWQF